MSVRRLPMEKSGLRTNESKHWTRLAECRDSLRTMMFNCGLIAISLKPTLIAKLAQRDGKRASEWTGTQRWGVCFTDRRPRKRIFFPRPLAFVFAALVGTRTRWPRYVGASRRQSAPPVELLTKFGYQLIALKIISADSSATRRETGLAPILGQACFTDKSFAMRGRIEVRIEVVPPQRMRE